MDSPESKLISLATQLISLDNSSDLELVSCTIIQIISLVSSMDLDSQPKPETKLMSLIAQTISLFNSMDLDSQPEPLRNLISLITQELSLQNSIDSDSEPKPNSQVMSLYSETFKLKPRPELISIIVQIYSLFMSPEPDFTDSDSGSSSDSEMESKLISVISQILTVDTVVVTGEELDESQKMSKTKSLILRFSQLISLVSSMDLDSEPEPESELISLIKQIISFSNSISYSDPDWELISLVTHASNIIRIQTRKCFCCEEDLEKIFYYCSDCDYAMNIVCAEKPPVLYIDHPNWHQHTLALFPRQAFLTCNVCALADASSPIYMCPPCDFVVHLRCINLPRVIRISRHSHRISFTPLFDQRDRSCGVCRENIDNDFGGYSCIKDDCSYGAHSRCATQRNVWDGIELEGVLEEIEEEVEPFVTISDGIIQHFSHQQHHLRLDENKDRDYDDSKQCDACITPIYFGNLYYCMQCSFILHEECANLSRKIHHPIHPHMLSLVGGYNDVRKYEDKCSACPWSCIAGFFYVCDKEGCYFKIHVQCATISEPLVHESHMDPLFLTSKPGEQRGCSVCKDSRLECTNETFNCIKCDFALCFGCATLPQNVRYKHDDHILTLSYGKETSTDWCEVCEEKVSSKDRFYKCDEYCCVTLHIRCLIGKDLYMKPGSLCIYKDGRKLFVLPNNHMSRPSCTGCRKRCPYKTVLVLIRLIFCSTFCIHHV
ncbi:putative chromatin regulator PHD family [Arabidopsis thaliana]